MRFPTLILIVFSLFVLVGCHSSKSDYTPIDSTLVNTEGIVFLLEDGFQVVAIRDKSSLQEKSLFEGSFDDSLLFSSFPPQGDSSAVNVFLVFDGSHRWLIDAGLGTNNGGALLAKLKALHIDPSNIDAVLLTHLHPDHIGGLLWNGQPSFPNADIYLSVDEFNAWSDEGVFGANNSLWRETLASISSSIRLVNDNDTILDRFVVHLAPGHTPGHTLYQLDNVLFIGDLVHSQSLQLKYPDFCARYDFDNTQSVLTRKLWLKKAKNQHLTIAGAHLYDALFFSDSISWKEPL